MRSSRFNSKLSLFILSLSALFGFLSNSFAGRDSGGGNVFVCPQADGNVKVEVVDLYEARLRGLKVQLGDPKLSVDRKVKDALARLALAEKYIAKQLNKIYLSLAEKSQHIPNAKFPSVNDSFHFAEPDGCELKQAAIQKVPLFKEDKEFIFSANLWEKMDNDNKATLILHELAYRWVRNQRVLVHEDSVRIRYFVGKWLANELNFERDKEKYEFFAKDLRFEVATFGGVGIKLVADGNRLPTFYANHLIEEGISAVETLELPNAKIRLNNSLVQFHLKGHVQEIIGSEFVTIRVPHPKNPDNEYHIDLKEIESQVMRMVNRTSQKIAVKLRPNGSVWAFPAFSHEFPDTKIKDCFNKNLQMVYLDLQNNYDHEATLGRFNYVSGTCVKKGNARRENSFFELF